MRGVLRFRSAGRVCGQNAMTKLDSSMICVGGYFCPPGTSPGTQFMNKCPAGEFTVN